MNLTVRKSRSIKGSLSLPGDKSIAHRAIILGSLANGESIIRNLPYCQDITATLNCLRALGVKIKLVNNKYARIAGCGLKGFQEPFEPLDAQNSGTTIRLLAGLLSIQPFFSPLIGSKQLTRRPMGRVVEPLRQMGAWVLSTNTYSKTSKSNNNFAPLVIKGGKLKAINYTLTIPSAQVKSALLIAGLRAKGTTKLRERIPTRDHTERMLKSMGANISYSKNIIKLKSPARLKPIDIKLPGDISSAAYFIAAAILTPNSKIRINNICLNPSRLGFIKILQKMGANIKIIEKDNINNEPIGVIEASYSKLVTTRITRSVIPSLIDEIPILAVVATQAQGTTVIRDADELRVKESDRISAIVTELKRLKADIKETRDGLIIKGPTPLKGAVCNSHNDHRIAMSLTIAGLIARGKTTIHNTECISKSFIGFERVLKGLTSFLP